CGTTTPAGAGRASVRIRASQKTPHRWCGAIEEASHALFHQCASPVGSFALEMVLAARLVQRGCIGDGVGERFGETAVAPSVHVKSVRREECFERNSLVLVPMAHEGEAMKYVDLLLRGGARGQLDHMLDLALSNDFRR